MQKTLCFLLLACSVAFLSYGQVGDFDEAVVGATGGGYADELGDDCYEITGIGFDIWGDNDNMYYLYLPDVVVEDFSATVRIDSYVSTTGDTAADYPNEWGKVGIMARSTLDPGATNAFMAVTTRGLDWGGNAVTGERRLTHQWRDTTDAASGSSHDFGYSVPIDLKLQRRGNTFSSFYKYPDEDNWTLWREHTTAGMEEELYLGVANTNHDAAHAGYIAEFCDFEVTELDLNEITDFAAVDLGQAVELSWSPDAFLDVDHYEILRTAGGQTEVIADNVPGDADSYTDNDLGGSVSVIYYLKPVLTTGETSVLITQVVVGGVGPNGEILRWVLSPHYIQAGGADPGAAKYDDYLTDGGDVTEQTLLPVPGMEVPTDFVFAASTGCNCGTAPGCLCDPLTWFEVSSQADSRFNFSTIYGAIDNVMTYMVSYLYNHTGTAQYVRMVVYHDDAYLMLLDNTVVWEQTGWGTHETFIVVPPGEHRLMLKIFEGGGGHDGGIQILNPATGQAFDAFDFTVSTTPIEMTDLPAPTTVTGISAIEIEGGYDVTFAVSDEAGITRFHVMHADSNGIVEVGQVTPDGSLEYTVTDDTDVSGVDNFSVYVVSETAAGDVLSYMTLIFSSGINSNGNILNWLLLGQYQQPNGANPSHGIMAQDYLTEGDGGLTENTIIPVAGMQMQTNYTVAASTGCDIGTAGAPYTCPPSWVPINQVRADNTVIFGAVDNVMTYQVTYVTNSTGAPVEALLGYNTDDGCMIKLDNAIIAERLVGCCNYQTQTVYIPEGEHRLMIKTFEGGGGFYTEMRITDPAGTPFPQGTLSFSTVPTMTELLPAPIEITRSGPLYILDTATEVPVTLILPEGNTDPVDIYEIIPAEYGAPFDITGGGTWDDANGRIVWTGVTETVSYSILPIAGVALPQGFYNVLGYDMIPLFGGTLPAIVQDLGDGWRTAHIADDNGVVGEVVSFTDDGGMYSANINAGGSDIWGTADEFQFLWQEFPADSYVEITCRLDMFQQGINDWSKAGLMFRTDVSRGSPFVDGVIRSLEYNGYIQWRDNQNTACNHSGVFTAGVGLPTWFRAVYLAGAVTMFYAPGDAVSVSADEVDWTLYQGTHNLNIGDAETIAGGICVTSHDNDALVNAQFSNIEVYVASAPKLENFMVAENGDGDVELTWDLSGDVQFDTIMVERLMLPFDLEWEELETLAGDATSFVDTTNGLISGQYSLTTSFDTGGAAGILTNTYVVDYQTASLPDDTLAFQEGVFPASDYDGCQDAHIIYHRSNEWDPVAMTGTQYNTGGHNMIEEGDWNGGHTDHKEALIQFDLGGALAGKTVQSATLYLYFDNCRSGQYQDHTSFAHPILKEWNEGSGTGVDGSAATTGAVTWQSAIFNAETPGDSSLWQDWIDVEMSCADLLINRSGGAYGENDIETREAESTVYGATQYLWVEWNITDIAQDWASGVLPNNGLKITQQPFDIYDPCYDYIAGGYDFRSSNHAGLGTRPLLIIEVGESTGVGRFIGDANCDNGVNIADAVAVLTYLFAGGEACCLTNMDANGDNGVNIADAVAVLSYLFAGGTLQAPGGVIIETTGCQLYDPALISEDIMPCDTPCPYAK